MVEPKLEMAPHWFSVAIHDAIDPHSLDFHRIARRCGDVIASHAMTQEAIWLAVLQFDDYEASGRTDYPGLAQLIREKIGESLLRESPTGWHGSEMN